MPLLLTSVEAVLAKAAPLKLLLSFSVSPKIILQFFDSLRCTHHIKLKQSVQTKGWKVTIEIISTIIQRRADKCQMNRNSKRVIVTLTKSMIFWHSEISFSNRDIYRTCQIFARCGMSNIYFVHIAMSDCNVQYWHFPPRAGFILCLKCIK